MSTNCVSWGGKIHSNSFFFLAGSGLFVTVIQRRLHHQHNWGTNGTSVHLSTCVAYISLHAVTVRPGFISAFSTHSFHASLQYREALLRLMVDVSVMLGADEQAAEAQMKLVLDFEMELAKVRSKTLENLRPDSFKSLALRKTTGLSVYLMLQWTVCSSVDRDPLWKPHQWEHVQQVQFV